MALDLSYRIYSHADADGGIAAAIFTKFILDKYGKYGWNAQCIPVNHGGRLGEWHLQEVKWPCAILDFTLHPSLLSEKFFHAQQNVTKGIAIPECYWIDHHPTGANYPFLDSQNTKQILPFVKTKWDTKAISTPGLLRTHYQELELPASLIRDYEEFIDMAEIIDGALYATCESAHDYSSPAVKIQSLFSTNHSCVDKEKLYKRLVRQISRNPRVEDLFDSDFLYDAIIKYEAAEYNRQLQAYTKVTKKVGKVAFADFSKSRNFAGLGRFLPYLIFNDANYALHIMPKSSDQQSSSYSLSCGINPWNKPQGEVKHLGNYFAQHFSGGGHAFVAGGKVTEEQFGKIEALLEFLNS